MRVTLASKHCDPALEQSLLAAISLRPNTLFGVDEIVKPEDFTSPHGNWFEALRKAIADDLPCPALELNGAVPSEDPLADARKIRDLALRRRHATTLEKYAAAVEDDETPVENLVPFLEDAATELGKATRIREGASRRISDVYGALKNDVDQRHAKFKETGTTVFGVPTGFGPVDKELGGLFGGLHLFAGEPGAGKTTFVLNVAINAAQTYPVLFVSFEEEIEKLFLKALCAMEGVKFKDFRNGKASGEDLERIYKKHGSKLDFLEIISGSGATSVASIKAKAKQLMRETKRDKVLIVVDYLQQWAATRKDFNDYRHVVASLQRELRDVALALKSPILLISSQNRSGQGEASMTSLKESGDLEYGGDSVMILTKAEKESAKPPARDVTLHLVKNREGDRRKWDLVFHGDKGQFKLADAQYDGFI